MCRSGVRSRIVYKSACPSELRKDPSWLQSHSHTTTTSGMHAANTVMLVCLAVSTTLTAAGHRAFVRLSVAEHGHACSYPRRNMLIRNGCARTGVTGNNQSLPSSVLSSFARSLIGSGRDSFGRLRYYVITCSEPLSRFGCGLVPALCALGIHDISAIMSLSAKYMSL